MAVCNVCTECINACILYVLVEFDGVRLNIVACRFRKPGRFIYAKTVLICHYGDPDNQKHYVDHDNQKHYGDPDNQKHYEDPDE